MVPKDDEINDDDSPLRLDRRQHNNIKDWAVIITLAINLAGLVWTVAKWSSAIEQLQKSSVVLENNKDAVNIKLNTHENRLNIIEFQVNRNSQRINEGYTNGKIR